MIYNILFRFSVVLNVRRLPFIINSYISKDTSVINTTICKAICCLLITVFCHVLTKFFWSTTCFWYFFDFTEGLRKRSSKSKSSVVNRVNFILTNLFQNLFLLICYLFLWYSVLDLNQRPLGCKPNALTSWANRVYYSLYSKVADEINTRHLFCLVGRARIELAEQLSTWFTVRSATFYGNTGPYKMGGQYGTWTHTSFSLSGFKSAASTCSPTAH